jgi:uncharacterized Fe-S cluster protein YjdI
VLGFATARCIHARHCVLGEPAVFLANTPGVWLVPDQATPERIAIVAACCPSGAITSECLDGGPGQAAPRVNVLRVRAGRSAGRPRRTGDHRHRRRRRLGLSGNAVPLR